jgi:hypothetical protein
MKADCSKIIAYSSQMKLLNYLVPVKIPSLSKKKLLKFRRKSAFAKIMFD